MKAATRLLPGLEDVEAPPGLAGWDYALWRVERLPAKRIVLRALKKLAGTRAEIHPTNATIRDAIAALGFEPPTERGLALHLAQLDRTFRLIDRADCRRAKSRRKIRFRFLGDDPGQLSFKGADRQRPWVSIVGAHGRKSSAPMGVDPRRPPSAQVEPHQGPAQAPVSPLNSIQNSEGEETLTSRAREGGGDEPGPPPAPAPTVRSVHARLERLKAEAAAREAAAPGVEIPPDPPPPHVPTFAPTPVHVETVDRLARLAAPCGPEAVEAAARQAAARLGDEHSLDFHRKVCAAIRAGELPAKVAVAAFRKARSPGVRVPGAVYASFLREHAPPPGAQKPAPGPHGNVSPGPAT